jgi:2-hydroxychromene-2-carboxylate isomerase
LSLINRIALIGAREDWCAQFVQAAYRRWFVNGKDPTLEPDLSGALQDIGQDANDILERATSDEMKAALQSKTDAARVLEIFGSPTFATAGEIFWGDDRLEDAVRWQRQTAKQRVE